MESLFENKTKYSKELYDEYIKFHSKKYGVQELIFYALAIILLISLSIRAFNILKWKVIAIWLIIFLIIFVYLKNVKQSKKQYRSVIRRADNIVTYTFYDRYFETTYNGEKSKLYYIEIKKVFELDDRYYLYLNSDHACILMKDGFIKGTEEDFREFLDTKGMFRIKQVKNKAK